MNPLSYSRYYYQGLREDSESSAAEVVPLILRHFAPKTVVDVGCGSGTWTRVYKNAGARVLGIDGFNVRADQLLIAAEEFARHDLEKPLRPGRTFDLVNCLEVAEHLPQTRAESFIADLCLLGDAVVFSAAVPGQGGTQHINEQWQSYWIDLFERQGFQHFDCFRPVLWRNLKVAWWYVQNMFAFIRRERVADFPSVVSESVHGLIDIVHPRAFVRAAVPSEMSPRMLKEVVKALPHFPAKIMAHAKKLR